MAPTLSVGKARLLEADRDLGAHLSADAFAEAYPLAVFAAMTIESGTWASALPSDLSSVEGEVRGFLVQRGVVIVNLTIGGFTCTRLITPGDLMLLDGWNSTLLPVDVAWSTLTPSTLVLLDDRLDALARRWPQILRAIHQRAGQQMGHALVQQAIAQLPRVEDRLLALMWSLADKVGTVRPDGVWIELPITHRTLGRMVGASRPSVTIGLRRLAEEGTLIASPGRWRLRQTSRESLTSRLCGYRDR